MMEVFRLDRRWPRLGGWFEWQVLSGGFLCVEKGGAGEAPFAGAKNVDVLKPLNLLLFKLW